MPSDFAITTTQDAFLDDAAANCLAADSAPEAQVFSRALAEAPEPQRQQVAALAETAARSAAAAPFVEPPEALRGRVLQATSPHPFNMDDYRRRVETVPWYWRWGMVAAVVCLVASAYRNYDMQGALVKAQQQTAAVAQRANLNALHQAQALDMLLDPNVRQVAVRGQAAPGKPGNLLGKFLFDPRTRQCMLIMPHAVLPPTEMVHWTINNHGVQQQLTGPAVGAPSVFYLAGTLNRPLDQDRPVNLKVGVASFSSR